MGNKVIPEPDSYANQSIRPRDNNLLCLAIVLFMIGLGVIQGVVPIFILFFGADLAIWIMIILLGVLPTLGGIYVMWRWWISGS